MNAYHGLGRTYEELLSDRSSVLDLAHHAPIIEQAVRVMSEALLNGRTIYWCGNGGSAAQAQHMSAEFSGRFLRERRGLPSEALSVNTSTLTAIGNDFGFEYVFSRQVEAFVEQGDVLVCLTTSGKSQNLLLAVEAANNVGAATIALTGNGGGPIAQCAQYAIVGPTGYSAIVQEVHLILAHILCDLVEQRVMQTESAGVAQ